MLHSYEEPFQVDFLDKIKRVKSKTQNKKLTFGISIPNPHLPAAVHGDKWLGNSCRGTAALQCPLSTLQHPRQLSTPTHISHLSSLVVISKSHISFLCHHQMNCFQSCNY